MPLEQWCKTTREAQIKLIVRCKEKENIAKQVASEYTVPGM
jgi:hypothetical protein